MEQAALRQAGLRLQSIDITEMAFRNLGLQAGAAGINLALLRLRSSEASISAERCRAVHGAPHRAGHRTGRWQLRRDYPGSAALAGLFRKSAGQGCTNRLLLLMKRDGEQVMQALAGGLAVNLQRLDSGRPARDDVPLLDEREQAHRLTCTVGAALRQENS